MATRRPDLADLEDLADVARSCIDCGRPYFNAQPHAKYCSDTCKRRNQSRRKYHTRRVRSHNGEIELIHIRLIAERDEWTCHICRLPVTAETWSIDHLMPVSKGGPHTHDNVAIAHQRCNTMRGVEPQTPTTMMDAARCA